MLRAFSIVLAAALGEPSNPLEAGLQRRGMAESTQGYPQPNLLHEPSRSPQKKNLVRPPLPLVKGPRRPNQRNPARRGRQDWPEALRLAPG